MILLLRVTDQAGRPNGTDVGAAFTLVAAGGAAATQVQRACVRRARWRVAAATVTVSHMVVVMARRTVTLDGLLSRRGVTGCAFEWRVAIVGEG